MNSTLENEIVRLVKEISEDEKKLVALEEEAREVSRIEYVKNGYMSKIKSCKESLERKMRLLRSLKKD